MLLRAEAITKSFGEVKVLDRADLQINEGDAIGLIGINGAGKSTFMKILLGLERCDTGELIRNTHRIGYLEQFADSSSATVREVLGRPYGHVEHRRRRMQEIDDLMSEGGDLDWNALTTEYADLEQELSKSDSENEDNQRRSLRRSASHGISSIERCPHCPEGRGRRSCFPVSSFRLRGATSCSWMSPHHILISRL